MRRLALLLAPLAFAVPAPAPASATPACSWAYTEGTPAGYRRLFHVCVPHNGPVWCQEIWLNVPTGGRVVGLVCLPVQET